MNKKLLIGLTVGLVAYYFLMMRGRKKCDCQSDGVEPKEDLKNQEEDLKNQKNYQFCKQYAETNAGKIAFIDDKARQQFIANLTENCIKNGIK